MEPYFNKLTPAEAERLALLIEECGEVIQAATKVLRHGYASWHPDAMQQDNRSELAKEIGHAMNAVEMLVNEGDIDQATTNVAWNRKKSTIAQWLHHQEPSHD